MEYAYFEDFRVDESIVSPARTITETDIVLFAALTGDWHSVHSNVEYAKLTAFRDRIAHGLLIVAIGAGLMFRAGKRGLPISSVALSGIDKARFVGTVKIGDTIHVEARVVQVKVIDEKRGSITISHRVLNQKDEQVTTYESKVIVNRRPAV
jgi:3-hydroxybutyryl-CoA dehydratase